ncbi:hypothetical protein PsexTeo8_23320 [Pseudomonas extremaustralis]|nr:hypothetical protein [Pseudomonas extremaustralis]
MMNAPRVSHPREPGLFARAPNLERYRVAAGGVTLVDLQPGDGLQVIDLEAGRPANCWPSTPAAAAPWRAGG